mmetsp:Transcript_117426/g.269729  ORF Transcript_117426/g.269729 Transcript_117426/m.269729 type:complete len:268 (-) Transcript_117426:431-1234(-)
MVSGSPICAINSALPASSSTISRAAFPKACCVVCRSRSSPRRRRRSPRSSSPAWSTASLAASNPSVASATCVSSCARCRPSGAAPAEARSMSIRTADAESTSVNLTVGRASISCRIACSRAAALAAPVFASPASTSMGSSTRWISVTTSCDLASLLRAAARRCCVSLRAARAWCRRVRVWSRVADALGRMDFSVLRIVLELAISAAAPAILRFSCSSLAVRSTCAAAAAAAVNAAASRCALSSVFCSRTPCSSSAPAAAAARASRAR